jgi:hypothetical protein
MDAPALQSAPAPGNDRARADRLQRYTTDNRLEHYGLGAISRSQMGASLFDPGDQKVRVEGLRSVDGRREEVVRAKAKNEWAPRSRHYAIPPDREFLDCLAHGWTVLEISEEYRKGYQAHSVRLGRMVRRAEAKTVNQLLFWFGSGRLEFDDDGYLIGK